MKNSILIDRIKHNQIYIFEGHITNFFLSDSENSLYISFLSGVEYLDTMDDNIQFPEYNEKSQIKLIDLSYLKFEIDGPVDFLIEIGELKEGEHVLDYGGVWGNSSMRMIPTGFRIQVVCKDIEISF